MSMVLVNLHCSAIRNGPPRFEGYARNVVLGLLGVLYKPFIQHVFGE